MRHNAASILTLSFNASERVLPPYAALAPHKASLETCVRYAAYELGESVGARVNCVSCGPLRTLSSRGIKDFAALQKRRNESSFGAHALDAKDVVSVVDFLGDSNASRGVTGQTIVVDMGASLR